MNMFIADNTSLHLISYIYQLLLTRILVKHQRALLRHTIHFYHSVYGGIYKPTENTWFKWDYIHGLYKYILYCSLSISNCRNYTNGNITTCNLHVTILYYK